MKELEVNNLINLMSKTQRKQTNQTLENIFDCIEEINADQFKDITMILSDFGQFIGGY